MATNKRVKGATNAGRIVGMVRMGGEWLFSVQVFSTSRPEQPIVCMLSTVDQLKGSVKKKAERWQRFMCEKAA